MYPIAMREAHQIAVRINLPALIGFVVQGEETLWTKCVKGIPPDAEFIRSHWTGETIALIFEHESFPMAYVGMVIPFLEPEFEEGATPLDTSYTLPVARVDFYGEPKGSPYEAV